MGAIGSLKAPRAAAITGAKLKFAYENHHFTDDEDRDPYHEPLIDPNASPCPVRLYLGAAEPAHGFGGRGYGSLWYSEDMIGTGRHGDTGMYLDYGIRDLDQSVLTPGTWHWYRAAGRQSIQGDLDAPDWPWARPDWDPAYADWESNWTPSEFYFKVQWEYH